jgi:hypothetical protein
MKLTPGLAATLTAATLTTATLAALPANAAGPASPTQLAGDWISTQLTDGLAFGDFGADIGLTIDAGLALDAIGDSGRAGTIADSIAGTLVTSEAFPYGYARSDEYDWQEPYDFVQVGRYANATAKAAAFTERIGRDASTEYDSIDLVAQLEDLTDDTTGVIADDSSFGDFANTIGQAFAVEALARAGSGEAAAATDALLAQQCPAGYFLFTLGSTACGEVPSADTTAIAVISLRESGLGSARVAGAVSLATQWLESVQLADGSFAGDASAPGSNANSTGLAGWALGEAGRTAAATKAAAWTRGLQAADPGACATQAPTGAIAYNAEDLATGRASGPGAKVGVWRRATFQSAPALRWAPPAGAALGLTAPASAAAGSKVDVVVRGLAAGEHGCVTHGTAKRLVTGTGGDVALSFDLPATAPATHTFTVTTLSGAQSATTTVAAPPVAAPVVGDLAVAKVAKVGRNDRFKIAVACDGAVACTGKLKVRTAGKVERADGTKARLVVAKSAYTVDPGRTATVRLTLTKPARAVLGAKRIRVVATQTARGAEPVATKFWLRRR